MAVWWNRGNTKSFYLWAGCTRGCTSRASRSPPSNKQTQHHRFWPTLLFLLRDPPPPPPALSVPLRLVLYEHFVDGVRVPGREVEWFLVMCAEETKRKRPREGHSSSRPRFSESMIDFDG
ncbi:unnamed protein product, partial [Ectocarpus sp. 12 AP-2014]